MRWTYKGKNITKISQMPTGTMGFIYRIVTVNGDKYIGRKQILHIRKRKFSKKKIEEMKDKRMSRYKLVTTESDWLNYSGSSKPFNLLLQTGIDYEKEILRYCSTKAELAYYEAKYQFSFEVLEDPSYYNDNIGSKYFRGWLEKA